MSDARHILFVTGTRADFGKLEPLAARARDTGHKVTFFVTGMSDRRTPRTVALICLNQRSPRVCL